MAVPFLQDVWMCYLQIVIYLFIYSLREVVFIKQLADMRYGKIAIVYSVHRVLGVSQVCSATGKYVACLRRTR